MKLHLFVKRLSGACLLVMLNLMFISTVAYADDDEFRIKESKWDDEKSRLLVKGKGENGQTVTVVSVLDGSLLGSAVVRDDKWRVRTILSGEPPCEVQATQSDGQEDSDRVDEIPSDCSDTQPPPTAGGNYTVLAANDLGMHCADQDFRIFSILPPYNVLNAQVLKKGREPELMSPADGIQVTYRAVKSNIIDFNDDSLPPIATDSITKTNQNDSLPGVFKSNFWDGPAGSEFGFLAYEKLYPAGVLGMFPFEADLGLPAPDVAELYLGGGALHAEQAAMPGIDDATAANEAQPFHGFVEDFPFFVNFPFGYTVAKFNRYTAEGIPTGKVDDEGRDNPYPLMRVEAIDAGGNVLAQVDAVTPVASEADCAICHAAQEVCAHDSTNTPVCDDIANANYEDKVSFISTEGEVAAVIGANNEQQVINAAKINILRLHDFKHPEAGRLAPLDGTSGNNVVCANCHYSPALDLAHLGPTDANGKQQTQHISMSRAMHGVHGSLPTKNPQLYGDLFPVMPPPDERTELTASELEKLLFDTCYNCHPGKKTQCLRGAMGGAGTVCQDCHGQMTQVGDDFTENFPTINFPKAGSADLNKRVSWASEPTCQACHVGDVLQVAELQQNGELDNTLTNMLDKQGNADGLRLSMTYKTTDHPSNGGGDNLKLLNFPDSRFATTEALYRLSGANKEGQDKGHGDLSCENCHGSTHAIWPNKNPYSNDNKAAEDLQGHAGSIIECDTCHEGDLGNTLEGPHGMHPVGDTRFAEDHEELAEQNGDACRACHGMNGEGTVLSRMATTRNLPTKEDNKRITLSAGTVVSCTLCHENEL